MEDTKEKLKVIGRIISLSSQIKPRDEEWYGNKFDYFYDRIRQLNIDTLRQTEVMLEESVSKSKLNE